MTIGYCESAVIDIITGPSGTAVIDSLLKWNRCD